jgi:prepilin-type N-terminal cleavage/methylation domain-containing protein
VQQNGFTLLEVVIALAVLAIVSLSLGQALLQGQQHARIIEEDRDIRAKCQSLLMELAHRNWGTSFQTGTIAYLYANSPSSFQLSGFPNETGTITVTNVTTVFYPGQKSGSVYRIEVAFRYHVFITYVNNVS